MDRELDSCLKMNSGLISIRRGCRCFVYEGARFMIMYSFFLVSKIFMKLYGLIVEIKKNYLNKSSIFFFCLDIIL